METVIKVDPSELDSKLLNKIRKFIGKDKNVDVTISLREFDPRYSDKLNLSIEQAEQNVTSMTMQEFLAYKPNRSQ